MSRRKTIVAMVVAVVVVSFAGLALFNQTNNAQVDYGQYKISAIKDLAGKIQSDNLNPDQIYEASEDTGGLPEKVIGDLSTAEVVLYEYADYACSHCASWSVSLDKMVEESDGKLAVVYRGYLLPGFKNNLVVASAATAAQIQGCWKEYKDLLFANQVSWANASGDELKDELISCFEIASKGKGDTEKFLADMTSEAVAKKVAFEYRLGSEAQLKGTPTFRLNGESVEIQDVKAVIKEELSKA